LGRFFKKLAKLVKLTLEKKCSLFFCQNKQWNSLEKKH
jgi:hypothetical protein